MKYTEIAWDFDGCLYDSYDHIISCIRSAVGRFGYSATAEEIFPYVRVSVPHAFRHFAPLCGCKPENLGYWYRQAGAQETSDLVRPYDGIPELLRDIAASGRRNHICSNRRISSSAAYLERDGLLPYFDVIAGPDMEGGIPAKPQPDLVIRILKEHGTEPCRLLMIGDRELDLLAGHGAGSDACFFDPDRYCTVIYDAEFRTCDVDELRRFILG